MNVLSDYQLNNISGGAIDDTMYCPKYSQDGNSQCPTVVVTGPPNNGTASVSLSQGVWGIVGSTGLLAAGTVFADGFIAGAGIAAGIAAGPILVPIVIGGAAAIAGATLAQAIANSDNGSVTVSVGRSRSGIVQQPGY